MTWILRGETPCLKPEVTGGKPLSFKTKMDLEMERKIENILWSLRRNANGGNARRLLGSPGCPDDSFFFHIVNYFTADIFSGSIAYHRSTFWKQ